MPVRLVPISRTDDMGLVRLPMPSDVLAPALRAAYGEQSVLPDDMLRLLQTIERSAREH